MEALGVVTRPPQPLLPKVACVSSPSLCLSDSLRPWEGLPAATPTVGAGGGPGTLSFDWG